MSLILARSLLQNMMKCVFCIVWIPCDLLFQYSKNLVSKDLAIFLKDIIHFDDKILLWMFILTYYFLSLRHLSVAIFVLVEQKCPLSFSSVYSSNQKNKGDNSLMSSLIFFSSNSIYILKDFFSTLILFSMVNIAQEFLVNLCQLFNNWIVSQKKFVTRD